MGNPLNLFEAKNNLWFIFYEKLYIVLMKVKLFSDIFFPRN